MRRIDLRHGRRATIPGAAARPVARPVVLVAPKDSESPKARTGPRGRSVTIAGPAELRSLDRRTAYTNTINYCHAYNVAVGRARYKNVVDTMARDIRDGTPPIGFDPST